MYNIRLDVLVLSQLANQDVERESRWFGQWQQVLSVVAQCHVL